MDLDIRPVHDHEERDVFAKHGFVPRFKLMLPWVDAEDIIELADWCDARFSGEYHLAYSIAYFESEAEGMQFYLAWEGCEV